METTIKRLYVGGISQFVTKEELADRFGRFGDVGDVEIIHRKDEQGNPVKTFAYLNINISDVNLKKCITVLNKTKWKGGVLQIETAKESFLHRLSQERQEANEKQKGSAKQSSQNDLLLSLEKSGVTNFTMKTAVPGTDVPNHRNWVVSKFGRVLPILHISGKKQNKIMKYDPSKYCHNIRKIDDAFKIVPVSQLTWQLKEGDDEISKKRRGEFPNLTPPPKKKVNGADDTQVNLRIHRASVQTAEMKFETNSYDSVEEEQAFLKREIPTRATGNHVEDSDIEVVDDSLEFSYTPHWPKQKAAPKMKFTGNTLDDCEYDSADTDEIITVTKEFQKRCDHNLKNKEETVKSNMCSQLKIQKIKEASTYAQDIIDKCKSKDTKINRSESDTDTDTSEDDNSDLYSDEEYKAMMQNCFHLDLTIKDLEKLAKEANEFDDEAKSDSEYDTEDIISSKEGYDIAYNLHASGSKTIYPLEQKQNVGAFPDIKEKLKTENLQNRLLKSAKQSNCESDGSNSDFEEHHKSLNKHYSRENIEDKVQEPKSPTEPETLVNTYELEKEAESLKEKTKPKKDPESGHVKRVLEPNDIVASILEDDSSCGQQSNQRKIKDSSVKPPTFKGLGSLLASAATANVKVSDDLQLNGFSCCKTKKTEEQEPFRGPKQICLEAKSKNRSSNNDNNEEGYRDFSCTSLSSAKPGMSLCDAAKEQTPKEKQLQDNQKRVLALIERRKERELQKQIIQGALLQLDVHASKKSQHIVFNSDSENETEVVIASDKKEMDSGNKAKQDTSMLFHSSGEDSDNEDKGFEIKTHYEGRSGMKLMQLQSHFGTDERFKMDSRFLESSSEDEEASEEHKSKVHEECDLSAEKKKNLSILQSIMNINVEPQTASNQTTKGKNFKDLNALHYDPAKEDHTTFETKAEGKKESKSERKKKRLEAEKLPDVSKETYHEIVMDFREVFGASKIQNTKEQNTTWDQEVEPEKKEADGACSNELVGYHNVNSEEHVGFTFSFFENSTDRNTSTNEPYKTEQIKPAKVAWQEDPRYQDSSSEDDDEEEAAVATENQTSSQSDNHTIRFFFFVKDDERLKTGPMMFFRSSNPQQKEEAWEQRQDILLEECRKRHKDAKRKMKAK